MWIKFSHIKETIPDPPLIVILSYENGSIESKSMSLKLF